MKYRLVTTLILVLACYNTHAREDFSDINLDTYLSEQGVLVTEGYVTAKQKAEFIQDLQRLPQIKNILEIGFNAGHSSELFLTTTNCEKLVSFDINIHSYTKIGAEFIQKKFGSRFELIEGDSKIQVPKFAAVHSTEKFDLIFIDGGHSLECCLSDIQNCSKLAHRETLVLIDDYVAGVKMAVDASVRKGLIVLLDHKHIRDVYIPNVNGGDRIWVVAQYVME